MQIIHNTYPIITVPEHLPDNISLSDLLLFDIETTGLSAEHSFIYLIGCVSFRGSGEREFTQLLADSADDEIELLTCFFDLARDFKVLVQYNGDRFDVPFVNKRADANGIESPLSGFRTLDLYKVIYPFRDLLGLLDLKQQTVEVYLNTGRIEMRSGADLVAVYKEYLAGHSDAMKDILLSHNEADVLGLTQLLPLLSYRLLMTEPIHLYKAEAKAYTDLDGRESQELLLSFCLDEPLPKPLVGSKDGCFFRIEKEDGLIKVPLCTEELKYFYANYKEYWYFPEEDMAMHRSVAQFAERTHRVPATAKTCYTRKSGSFLPEWGDFAKPYFKASYQDSSLYFEFTKERQCDRDFFDSYARYVLRHIIGIR